MSSNSSSNSSHFALIDECIYPEMNLVMFSLFTVYVVMMPLFVLVLGVGYQKWRKQRFTTLSHIDVFTFNTAVLELLGVLGIAFNYFGHTADHKVVWKTGSSMFVVFAPGQMLFHLVTCVERYLAVVHPIIYLRLRGSGGVRIRNVTTGCIWLVSFEVLVLVTWLNVDFAIIVNLLLSITSIAFGFCSLSVLCALIRPGPGQRVHADQSKQRAFHTMLIITGALSVRFLSNLVISSIQNSSHHSSYVYCVIGRAAVCFFVPSSLMLPLLFLQREGKIPGCGPKSDEAV